MRAKALISLVAIALCQQAAAQSGNVEGQGAAAATSGAGQRFSWFDPSAVNVVREPRGLCMVRINSDHTRAEVEVAPSQAVVFRGFGYVEQTCPVGPRYSYRLAALCRMAAELRERQAADFEKRFGIGPAALCERGREGARELGIKEATLPAQVERKRAEYQARARGAVLPEAAQVEQGK